MEKARSAGNRRGQRSRQEILDAALRLMAERGYAGTSVAVLSEVAGMPKSLIYHHFHSKGGLLSAVMEHGAHEFFAGMRRAHADPPVDGTHLERLRWYLGRTAEVFAQSPDFLRLHLLMLMSSESADVEIGPVIAQVRDDGRAYMIEQIAGAYADLGPERATALATRLGYFAIAGFDGAFVASQGDAARDIVAQMRDLAEAIDAWAERLIPQL
ncbi:TetR/AcrR family transcriptional regulator [Nocardioides sp.]|uniref:TetR/AcrR family transcriptional regulator n=1 Tax=Nocardioides sp. TaxID=35761 RepID=UPI00262458ED|nr:TetR/AcrR family transcriptional regulator [Nocardioides sp.]